MKLLSLVIKNIHDHKVYITQLGTGENQLSDVKYLSSGYAFRELSFLNPRQSL